MRTVLVLIAVAGACVALFTFAHWPVRCPVCGTSFATVEERSDHLRIAHRA